LIDKILFPEPLLIPPSRAKSTSKADTGATGKTDFAGILREKLPTEGLKFSQHALERLQSRGMSLSDNDVRKLEDAVDSVVRKGGRESLVMLGDAAFVVSVKNRTVITAMDRESMQGNVFTNIDSAVVCK
jgi:flagellar operon protein